MPNTKTRAPYLTKVVIVRAVIPESLLVMAKENEEVNDWLEAFTDNGQPCCLYVPVCVRAMAKIIPEVERFLDNPYPVVFQVTGL